MNCELPGIEATQKSVLTGVCASINVPLCEMNGILWELSRIDEESAVLTFGNLGKRLRAFACIVDKQHPDLNSLFGGELASEGDTSKRFCETLELCRYAHSRHMTKMIPLLRKASGYGLSKELKSIDDPRKVNRWGRLLLDGREELRNTKKPQDVCIGRDRLAQMWDGTPDNFGLFMRYDNQYRKEIGEANEQAKRYEDLGCPSNAKIIREEIAKFIDKFGDCHQGFHRITVMEAVIILAKMHGAELQVEKLRLGSSEPPYIEFNHIANWNLERFLREGIEHWSLSPQPIAYKAVVSPIHCLSFPSEEMVKVVDHLDHYPGFGGRALFDHLLVVWPQADLTARFRLCERQDSRVWDAFQGEAYDSLLKERKLIPVLLGERDGRCYFICYWM